MVVTARSSSGTFGEFAAESPGARFSEWLRRAAAPEWRAATGHRFTVELGRDRLDDAVFRRYLIQDYAFLETLVAVLGHAVGRAPTMAKKLPLARFLAAVTGEENTYFQRAFDALGVPEADREAPRLAPVTRSLQEVMLAACDEGWPEILAVLLPAEWIYLSWATAQKACRPARFYLEEWIVLHNVAEFAAFVDWLRRQMDLQGPALPSRRQRRVAELFRRMVELEVAFFDAAYAAE